MGSEGFLPWRPRDRTAAEYVQMNVEYRLAGIGVAVEDSAVAPLRVAVLLAIAAPPDHLADQRVVGVARVVERGDVAARDDQRAAAPAG